MKFLSDSTFSKIVFLNGCYDLALLHPVVYGDLLGNLGAGDPSTPHREEMVQIAKIGGVISGVLRIYCALTINDGGNKIGMFSYALEGVTIGALVAMSWIEPFPALGVVFGMGIMIAQLASADQKTKSKSK